MTIAAHSSEAVMILCKLSCRQEYVDRRHYVQVLCNMYDYLLLLVLYVSSDIIIYLQSVRNILQPGKKFSYIYIYEHI